MITEKVEEFARDVGWTTLGIGFALGIDYLFYMAAGRMLQPAEFGLFGVFMSIYYILVKAPFSSIEITSRKIEADGLSAPEMLGKPVLLLGALVFIGMLAASPLVTNLMNLPMTSYLVFVLVFPLVYSNSLMAGVAEGRQRFNIYALYEVVSSIFKFSALGLVAVGAGLAGAVSALVLETWSGFATFYGNIRPGLGSDFDFSYGKTLLRSFVYIVSINLVFSLDILLMGYFMSSETVGVYNSVAVLAKAVFFSGMAVNKAVFPKFDSSRNDLWLLKLSTAVILLEGLLATGFFALFGRGFLSFTFGSGYSAAAGFAPVYMVFMTLVAAVAMLGNYFLSTENKALWLILAMPAIELALIALYHSTVIEFIISATAATTVTLLLMVFYGYTQVEWCS